MRIGINIMQSPPWSGSGGRNNNLNLMRFIFAILVLFSHSYTLLYGERQGFAMEPLSILTRQQVMLGSVSVAFFFIISGYLITQSWLSSSGFFDYLKRRFLRIYPAFIVVFLFCFLIVAPLGARDWAALLPELNPSRMIIYQLLLYLPGMSSVFVDNPTPFALNGSAWTIRYEFWCYIILAVFGLLQLIKRRATCLLIFVCWTIFHLLTLFGLIGLPFFFENSRTEMVFGSVSEYANFLNLFLAGAVFYLYRDDIPYDWRICAISLVVLVFFSAIGVGLQIAMPIFGSYVLFYFAFHPKLKFHDFSKRGDFSYGLYLYGYPVQQLLVYYLKDLFIPVTLFMATIPITLALAILSWYIVEKPCMQLKHVSFYQGVLACPFLIPLHKYIPHRKSP